MFLSTHTTRPLILVATLALLLFRPSLALAGDLQWQALPDRERITISTDISEGVPGQVSRIAPTGVLIPFSQIPGGLHVDTPPEGARIFQGTRHQGRALVLVTQTPEFGYLIARQTNRELVLDFYHNPLGARWKASGPASTTETTPSEGVLDVVEPDSATMALQTNPQGLPQDQVPESERPLPVTLPQPTQRQPSAQAQAVRPPAQAQPATPQSTASRPVVVQLTGSPEQAVAGTLQAQAPVLAQPANSAPLPYSPAAPGLAAASGPPPAQSAPPSAEQPRPFLDTRIETSDRAAPLITPELPLSSIDGLGTSAISGSVDFNAPPPVPAWTPPPVPPVPQITAQPDASAAPPAPSSFAAQTTAPATPQTVNQPAPAAQPQPVQPLPGVGVHTGGSVYSGVINTGGPDDVPDTALMPQPAQTLEAQRAQPPTVSAVPSPQPIAQPAQGQPAQEQPAQEQPAQEQPAQEQPAQEQPAQEQPAEQNPVDQSSAPSALTPIIENQGPDKIYTDADGNPVPPPPDATTLLPEIQGDLSSRNFPGALEKSELLLNRAVLTPEQRVELLHVRAEMLFALNRDNLSDKFTEIADATNQAINYNQQSWRNAGALLRLGYMNLRLGNLPEAEARFNMLRRMYPNDENVPLTYYYWGDFHFNRDELQKSADEFQYILQEYPNSRYAREAALGLARAFYRLGYYEQSFNVVDYIEKRWERFYVEYPPFLNMMGDVAFRLNKLDYSLNHYWLYVNLEPEGRETDIILTRIGDIYSMKREKAASRELYNESLRRFPDRDGALVAMMRLAEDQINDDPTIAGMFTMFDGPLNLAPVDVYQTIITRHPDSALVPLAEIKLALWHLWKHQFTDTLDLVNAFIERFPDHDLTPKAREIALQTFAILATEATADKRYDLMRRIWEQYPIVREQESLLPLESRIALAVSYQHEGRPDEALKIVEPFFLGHKVADYSEMALNLVLRIYLEYDQWSSIREVARRVDLWELTPETQQQLDFAQALAAENMELTDEATQLWKKLYASNTLSTAQQAHIAFFLAKDAERERELEKAYNLGKEALRGLIGQVERNPNAQDTGKIQNQLASLIDVCENAGRMREALSYAEQYLDYLAADSPERNAVRYRMARIYRKQGDIHTWRTILSDIARKSPSSVYGRLASSELSAAAIAEDAARYSPTGRI